MSQATILHLLGIDDAKLTFCFSGRDFRRTDVHGSVVKDIIAHRLSRGALLAPKRRLASKRPAKRAS